MRANAQRAAQKARQAAADEVKAEAANKEQEGETDSLDFSSEFSSPDMGLSDQGGFTKMLDWKNTIEEEEDEEKRDNEEEDDESTQEWRSGSWGDRESDEESESEADSGSSDDELSQDASLSPVEQKPFLRPVGQSPILPPRPVGQPESKPLANVTPPIGPPVSVVADASTVQPFGVSWVRETPPEPLAARPANTAPIVLPERTRPQAQFALAPSGQLAQIEPTIADEAKRLILNPATEQGYEECVRLLARFGLGALRMCVRNKVKVEILDELGFAEHPKLLALGLRPEETPSDGAYLVESRTVLVDRRSLVGQPRYFHPALYYFAHAFDHAQGGETFSSRKAAAVVACFESSVRALNGFDFVDELAAADPVRYFARSVAVYLGRDDCSDPLWSHQDLFDFDRAMYDYLQYLFSRLAV